MVMYQKAYTPWTILFFVPMVFIGAFFLLNLTLAVIQSSYSETQTAKKAQLEKQKKEAEEMANGATSKQPDDDLDDDDDKATKKASIGVATFFVAKRAAKKLITYWKNHKM